MICLFLYRVAVAEAVCGNGVVEKGEECDCGYDEDKSCRVDKCCKGRTGAKEEPGECKLLPGKTCRLVLFCLRPEVLRTILLILGLLPFFSFFRVLRFSFFPSDTYPRHQIDFSFANHCDNV